jgi:predicted metalloprotease with PDZ domain
MRRYVAFLALSATLSACAPGAGPAAAPAPAAPAPGAAAPTPANAIVATIDLTALSNDRLLVDVNPPALEEDEVLFRLPRVVQGTYAISDFGKYAEDFHAYDSAGGELAAERMDDDTWRIGDARELDRVSYYVNDTFDVEHSLEDVPFSPSGTDIEPNVFVLNLHGFVGYFEGITEDPYELRITAPLGMSRRSALPEIAADTSQARGTVTDIYRGQRYFDVTDNPMMYGNLDIVTYRVDDMDVGLTVYSPGGAHSATALEGAMQNMMAAQRAYLGDLRTTDHYNVFLFLSADDSVSPMGYGALEHNTSTVAVLPEWLTDDQLSEEMVHTIAHEFFHTVSPLRVHSEDIQYFDYYSPTFSKHLWLYEGGAEYFANHFQVHEGLISRPDFYQLMAQKIENAAGYDDTMSFTVMSENVVDEPYADNYANVYEKGALIDMCIDIAMREQSGGERSLLSLMKELAAKYGPGRPFQDDALIDEIAQMTYPQIGEFLQTHVVGTVPIDYNDCLNPVGLRAVENDVSTTLFFLDQEIPFIDAHADDGKLFFRGIPLNSTLVAMGVQAGDVIETVNGVAYDLVNVADLIQASVFWAPTQPLDFVVLRDGEEVELTGRLGRPSVTRTTIEEIPDATAEQRALREAWLSR